MLGLFCVDLDISVLVSYSQDKYGEISVIAGSPVITVALCLKDFHTKQVWGLIKSVTV